MTRTTTTDDIPQNRDNLEAIARVDAAQAKEDHDYAAQEDFYREQRDYRYAGALNAMMNAKVQSGVAEWTAGDVKRLMATWQLLDETVVGNISEEVPNGFTVVARSYHQQAMARLAIEKAIGELTRRDGRASEGESSASPTLPHNGNGKATGLKGI